MQRINDSGLAHMLAVRLFSSDVAFVPKHNPILSLLNGSLTVSFWPLAGGE